MHQNALFNKNKQQIINIQKKKLSTASPADQPMAKYHNNKNDKFVDLGDDSQI